MHVSPLIDNVDGNTLLKAFKALLLESNELDIATGTFEIGAFLLLEETWQHLNAVRILIGGETTGRTREQLVEALKKVTHESVESEKEKEDSVFLDRLASVRSAIRDGKIQIRVYDSLHAKLSLMRSHIQHSSSFAIQGSSNFTQAGLTKNVQLNT